jgi:hypothetical protein
LGLLGRPVTRAREKEELDSRLAGLGGRKGRAGRESWAFGPKVEKERISIFFSFSNISNAFSNSF